MRDHGSKRAHSHASGSLTNSASNMDKLQSAFLMGRDRGGGDETSNNVKSNKGDEASKFGDKKGSVGHSRATHSYLSKRLSRQRGGGRSIQWQKVVMLMLLAQSLASDPAPEK